MELVRAGEVSEAQAVLDAAGLTCPDGKVWHAVFDERGVEYAVRGGKGGRGFEWVVFEPVGIVEGGKEDEDGWGGGIGDGVDEGRLRSKGKGRAVEDEDVGEGEVMRLRCRLSSTGRDHVVEVRKGEKIAGIMARLSQITGVSCYFFFLLSSLWRSLKPGIRLLTGSSSRTGDTAYPISVASTLPTKRYLQPATAPGKKATSSPS